MENKINIAELLKDCPRGMELYSPIFGEVYLDKIRPHLAIVVTTDKEQGDFKEFLYDGRYGMNGECMLFPSKGKTTWEGFKRPFKDGDIVVDDIFPFIYKDCDNTEIVKSYCGIDTKGNFWKASNRWTTLDKVKFATEEQKEKLFNTIKDYGYRWDIETKKLEKLVEPKFRVGDRIRSKKDAPINISNILITEVNEWSYNGVVGDTDNKAYISFRYQDLYELVPNKHNKFDVNILKPFDKVLVRCSSLEKWRIQIFETYDKSCKHPFICMGYNKYKQCIPYEGNEHLLGTNNEPDDFLKHCK